jgi:phospholipid N-methyltransferase
MGYFLHIKAPLFKQTTYFCGRERYMARAMTNFQYLRQFIKDKNVASLLPTSSFAVKRAFKPVDFKKYKVIVEYGPGEGAFTRQLLNRMAPDAHLIAIETNTQMVHALRGMKDERLTVVNDSAENILTILNGLGLEHADCVVSGIPFTFLKRPQRETIVRRTREALNDNGMFIVYQNSFYAVKYLEKEFNGIKKDFEPRNIPPLFIMRCTL